jgi:hypothetical protein
VALLAGFLIFQKVCHGAGSDDGGFRGGMRRFGNVFRGPRRAVAVLVGAIFGSVCDCGFNRHCAAGAGVGVFWTDAGFDRWEAGIFDFGVLRGLFDDRAGGSVAV